jgi:uncharacterized protein Yka (UPF0111/DUF47 family)
MMIFQFLAKIIPPAENRFYTFFEEAAEVCGLSAQLFYQIVHSDPKERDTCLIHTNSYKKRAVEALEGSLTLLNSSFITPIDREDIQLISTSLYKCSKSILKACGNLRSYNIDSYNDIVKNQAEILIRSTEELLSIITTFRKTSSLEEVTEISRRIKEIENRGDEILASATEELFSGKYDAVYVLKLREIYKGIENAVDRCSIISDLIMSVVLKHN